MLNSRLEPTKDSSIPSRMGRKLRYPEKREATFVAGTLARIQAIVEDSGGSQVGYIREAVEEKLARDEAEKKT